MEKDVPGVEPSFGWGKGERVRNKSETLGVWDLVVDCEATFSASVHFFRALFVRNLSVSSSSHACGKPLPFHVVWNVLPFAQFQNLSNNGRDFNRE